MEGRQKILIVDDEASVRKQLSAYLEEAHYECHMAKSVSAAEACLKRLSFDLILTAIQMSETSGLDLIGFVKAHYPESAVIVVSVIDDPEEAKAVLEFGVYGYIVKPFTRNQVRITVANALRQHRLELKEKAYQHKLEAAIQKRTAELHDQLAFLHTLLDAIPLPIYYKDMRGAFQGGNPAFEAFIGREINDVIGKTVYGIAPKALADIYYAADQELMAKGGKQTYEAKVQVADQTTRDVVFNKAVYMNGSGEAAGMVGVMLDITEKMALEQELRQAQKLEAIGQLAAGIAHEINTPIQYIGDNTSFLQEAFTDLNGLLTRFVDYLAGMDAAEKHNEEISALVKLTEETDLEYLVEEIPTALEQSMEGVQRVSKIVQAMREFSHPGTDKKVEVDLNKSLESTITVARNEWKYVAEMETKFADDLPMVPCFPGEMNQVFLNLIINAAHAIGDVTDEGRGGKGKISISTHTEDDSVGVHIGDSGSGIPIEVQDRIFDPFFTTKAVGKGTGQGLAIAHAVVVEKHNGSIRFETAKGQGTTFIIKLPLTFSTAEEAAKDA
jgi:two-component system, NtrC family, sensor kinase